MASKWENNEEIQIFREYLRIPSVHPDVDYTPCINFLIKQAEALELPYKVHHAGNDSQKPLLIITRLGTQPELPAILLTSHMDVVPVYEDHWTFPPFSAHIDDEGRIYARGSQDMKCVGTQYLAALRLLKQENVVLKRTIHVSFVPDEEIGGYTGMGEFVKSAEFQALNIAFALDEGMASPDDKFMAYYAERTIWQINFKMLGTAGHGSLLLKNTAGSKFQYMLNKLMEYREVEAQRLERDCLHAGDVTSINLTQLNGGVQSNVVPPLLEACFDIRIAIDVDLIDFEKMINRWCEEAGGDIELEWIQNYATAPATKVDDTNVYWTAMKRAFDDLNLTVETHVFSGGTDSQFLRDAGLPAIGFSPMNRTPVLMHDHDEHLQADVYLRGILIYKRIIQEIANVF